MPKADREPVIVGCVLGEFRLDGRTISKGDCINEECQWKKPRQAREEENVIYIYMMK